jgi:uncharacterized protein (TIGR02145 family)
MKKYLFFAAIAIAALVSCKKEIAKEEVAVKPGYVQLTLTAQCDVDSKASLNGKQVVWEVGEKVAVFTPASVEPNEFSVTKVEGTSVKIEGSVPEGTTSFVAAYPYEKAVTWDKEKVVKMDITDQRVLPSQSVDPDALASVAYFADATAVPTFKNIPTLLKFTVGVDGVSRVKISADTAGSLSGEVSVTVDADAAPAIAPADAVSSSIEIACADGFVKDQVYYAAIAPGAYKGFTVRSYVGGSIKVLSTDAEGEFQRNQVIDLGDIATNAKAVSMIQNISNAEELVFFLNNAASYKADEEVRLTSDIDLTGVTLPTATSFAGTFDGQGLSLKNWTSNGTALFAENKGTVKDFTLDASCQLSLPAEITNFAFVVVSNLGRVCGITNNADISGTDVNFKGGRLGAIVGVSTSPSSSVALTIENCVNNGDMIITTAANTSNTQYVGTIVGSMGGSTLNNLSECINNGALSITCSGTNTKNFYIGGVAGGTTNGSNNIKVKNNGDVSFICAGHEAALCLAGVSSYTTGATTDCVNTGKITFQSDASLKATFVAGIAGYFASNTMSGCVNRGDVTVTAARINGRNGIGDINSKVYLKINDAEQAITAGLTIGGLVSATGKSPVFADCENYGKVSLTLNNPSNSDGTHTAARPSAGGLVGDCSGPMTGCNNHGDVSVVLGNGTAFTAKNAGYTFYIGGIVGSGYNFSGHEKGKTVENALNRFTLENCNNTGNLYYKTDNTHTTNNAIGGISGWPGSENASTPYTAKNCNNSGNITYEGAGIKIRAGGIHGGTGRMDGCSNTGKITIISANSGSVAGSIAAFHSQAHTFSNCTAGGTVEAQCTINALGGLVGNLGNVAFTGMDGCSVDCTLIGGPADATGLVVGLFNGDDKDIVLGTTESPISVAGSVNGTTVDATNFESLVSGSKNNTSGLHVIHTNFKAPVFVEDLANNKFTYHGKEYPIVKLADGRWWMAKNLAFLPAGMTPATDLTAVTAGVFAPIKVTGEVVGFSTDPDLVASNGYLYQAEAAFGLQVGDLTSQAQAEAMEGTQGICPPGWYIPTLTDIMSLVGKTAGVADNSSAPYFGRGLAALNADGFNVEAVGAITIQDNTKTAGTFMGQLSGYTTRLSSSMILGSSLAKVTYNTSGDASSGVKNMQFYGLMPMTNKPTEADYTCNGTMISYRIAGPLRCIRKAD